VICFVYFSVIFAGKGIKFYFPTIIGLHAYLLQSDSNKKPLSPNGRKGLKKDHVFINPFIALEFSA
jgi:hypothetical protein